jgi:ribosomal protein L40E
MKVLGLRTNVHFLRFLAVVFLVTCSSMLAMASQSVDDSKQTTDASRPVAEECNRCHDVKMYQLKSSSHAFDKDKKEISCEQCHHFHYSPLTSYYARDEYYNKKIFPPGAFDRRKMQVTARESMQAKKCQVCHTDLYKNAKGEVLSEIGQLCHDAFLGKNGETRRTCAGCHLNIAHLPIFDREQRYNADFAGKLAEKEGMK